MTSLTPSSPRLPSPPPPAEIQIGPVSPSTGPGNTTGHQPQQMEQTAIDANAKRRIHPGTKASEMAAGPPLVALSELDSAFQLQEHLAALHYHHTATNTNPVNRETALLLATPPPGIDRTLWLYELCRFLIEQCNALIVGFLFDTPPCSAVTCPEMRASEWQFLCAVHEQPKSCCAIDYCCHTLDWAANVVTNPHIFPSRFVALSDAHDKGSATKNLVNVFRRLHRIFAHAWFQHRGVFWTVEGQTGLYVFFKTVCDMYDLLPGENYKLPPEAEGLEPPPRSSLQVAGAGESQQPTIQPTAIAQPPGQQTAPADADDDHLNAASSRTSTRRHIRSSPSTGSAVTTVMEADEDDGSGAADMTGRFRKMRIFEHQTTVPEEETDAADVPVIVEHSPQAPVAILNRNGGSAPTEPEPLTAKGGSLADRLPDVDTTTQAASATEPSSFLESPDSETPVEPPRSESQPDPKTTNAESDADVAPPTADVDDNGTDPEPASILKNTSVADFAERGDQKSANDKESDAAAAPEAAAKLAQDKTSETAEAPSADDDDKTEDVPDTKDTTASKDSKE